jgi:hypothetical protein
MINPMPVVDNHGKIVGIGYLRSIPRLHSCDARRHLAPAPLGLRIRDVIG